MRTALYRLTALRVGLDKGTTTVEGHVYARGKGKAFRAKVPQGGKLSDTVTQEIKRVYREITGETLPDTAC